MGIINAYSHMNGHGCYLSAIWPCMQMSLEECLAEEAAMVRAMDTAKDRWYCRVCGRKCTSQEQLQKHFKLHTREYNKLIRNSRAYKKNKEKQDK